MSGRIRTVKPEWLEDEDLLRAGTAARVLSIAMLLLADDYGRGRCIPEVIAHQVFCFEREPLEIFREALARLSGMGFVRLYEVRGQRYFEVRNWSKHQKVDKPGKPRVPPPNTDSRGSREGLAPDLIPHTSYHDHDLDHEGSETAREPATLRQALEAENPRIDGSMVADEVATQLARITGKRWDAQGHHAALRWIADQPLIEWELVKAALDADPWVRQKPGQVTPRHIQDQWPKYSDGPRAGNGSTAPASREEHQAEYERQQAALPREQREAQRPNPEATF